MHSESDYFPQKQKPAQRHGMMEGLVPILTMKTWRSRTTIQGNRMPLRIVMKGVQKPLQTTLLPIIPPSPLLEAVFLLLSPTT